MPRLLTVAEIVRPDAAGAAFGTGPAEPTAARALVALTDEELLAALGEDPVAALVRAPFLGELPESERTGAMRSGLRSLVARGLVEAPDMADTAPNDVSGPADAAGLSESDVPQLETADELADVLTFYRTAERVALIDIPVAGERRRQFSVLLPSRTLTGNALVEEVTQGGLHGFSVLGQAELTTAVWQAGIETEVAPLLDGSAAIEVAVVSQGADEPTVVLVGRSPNGAWQVRTRYGVEGDEAVKDGDLDYVRRVLAAVFTPDADIAAAAAAG